MTKQIKIITGILGVLIIIYIFNVRSQNTYQINTTEIFNGNIDDIAFINIEDGDKDLQLVRSDTTWKIANADSLTIKDNQIDNLFNKVLKVQKEVLMTSKPEKWEKFGVTDSIGKHLKLFKEDGDLILHYLFGNKGQDYQHNYIRSINSDDVYRTDNNVFYLLNTNENYWGQVPPKAEPNDSLNLQLKEK